LLPQAQEKAVENWLELARQKVPIVCRKFPRRRRGRRDAAAGQLSNLFFCARFSSTTKLVEQFTLSMKEIIETANGRRRRFAIDWHTLKKSERTIQTVYRESQHREDERIGEARRRSCKVGTRRPAKTIVILAPENKLPEGFMPIFEFSQSTECRRKNNTLVSVFYSIITLDDCVAMVAPCITILRRPFDAI
jgi:hypothetical protein